MYRARTVSVVTPYGRAIRLTVLDEHGTAPQILISHIEL